MIKQHVYMLTVSGLVICKVVDISDVGSKRLSLVFVVFLGIFSLILWHACCVTPLVLAGPFALLQSFKLLMITK